jgi:hypothetical protein
VTADKRACTFALLPLDGSLLFEDTHYSGIFFATGAGRWQTRWLLPRVRHHLVELRRAALQESRNSFGKVLGVYVIVLRR